MKVDMEITGIREVTARMDRLTADVKNRLQVAVAERARSIEERSEGNGSLGSPATRSEVGVTFDSDGLGATIRPVPGSIKADDEASELVKAAEKAVRDVVGGSGI